MSPFKRMAKELLEELDAVQGDDARLSWFLSLGHRIEMWAIEEVTFPVVANPPDPDDAELSNFLYRASGEYRYQYRVDLEMLRFLIKYGLLTMPLSTKP